jgi:hypothetical protein
MRDAIILFCYHKCDELTVRHLDLLRRHNPKHVVIPVIGESGVEELPGSVNVAHLPSRWCTDDGWRSCDTLIYRWFQVRDLSARRYVYFEYDVLCTIPLETAYADAWNAPVAARDFFTIQNNPKWTYFNSERSLSALGEDRKYAAGLVPMAGSVFSHESLERIVDTVVGGDVLSELRAGTAVKKLGLKVAEFPSRLRSTLDWRPYSGECSRPGLYHSVKPDQERLVERHVSWERQLVTRLTERLGAVSPIVHWENLQKMVREARAMVQERSRT